jgi:hypothetical protein
MLFVYHSLVFLKSLIATTAATATPSTATATIII